jgi:hypothetical protein
MAAPGAATKVRPYVRRLLDDEHVQEELRELIADVRRSAARAKRVGPERAITDKRLRRDAAAGVGAAAELLKAFNRPKPRKRHRSRRIVKVAIVGAGAVIAYRGLAGSGGATG